MTNVVYAADSTAIVPGRFTPIQKGYVLATGVINPQMKIYYRLIITTPEPCPPTYNAIVTIAPRHVGSPNSGYLFAAWTYPFTHNYGGGAVAWNPPPNAGQLTWMSRWWAGTPYDLYFTDFVILMYSEAGGSRQWYRGYTAATWTAYCIPNTNTSTGNGYVD